MRIELNIPDENITNCLREAHSRYWCVGLEWFGARGWSKLVAQPPGTELAHVVVCSDHENSKVHRDDIEAGVAIFAKDHPARFGRLVRGMTDGDDGDVLLQLIAFGELVYG